MTMSNILYMGRRPGPTLEKVKKIRNVLLENPNGLWIRELARQTGLSRSTVSLYLERYMQNEIEDVFVTENNWIKIVRLKEARR